MKVLISGPGGKKTKHAPECDFEVPSSPDHSAALLSEDPDEKLPEEKDGFTATLNWKGDLCKADQEDEKEE